MSEKLKFTREINCDKKVSRVKWRSTRIPARHMPKTSDFSDFYQDFTIYQWLTQLFRPPASFLQNHFWHVRLDFFCANWKIFQYFHHSSWWANIQFAITMTKLLVTHILIFTKMHSETEFSVSQILKNFFYVLNQNFRCKQKSRFFNKVCHNICKQNHNTRTQSFLLMSNTPPLFITCPKVIFKYLNKRWQF